MITIREWMNGKTILITGGAGFIGKVLIEKLLRACPGVKRIYLIIRPKGGQTSEERWAEITKDKLFEKLLTDAPDIIDQKVTVLDGDMSLIDLGLSQETVKELKNSVNIIFHSAATVRFNDPLHKAVLTNSRGTLEMCKLASIMNYLEVFVHVSTTYCNHNLRKHSYEEKIYEPCQDWRTILKLIETENPAVMNTISYKITQDHPNTYTFTKSLSEKIVEDYSREFPTVILRPPAIIGTLLEPVPGWTDNLNGLMGFTTGVCKGVVKVGKVNETIPLNCIAVDYVINAIILCSWDKATSENKELSIYNCADANFRPVSLYDLSSNGLVLNEKECTLNNPIWYPCIFYVRNDFHFHVLFFLLNIIPAVFFDFILFLMKKKTRLMKITIKIYLALKAIEAFMMNEIVFDSKKYKALWSKLIGEEAEIFYVRVPSHINTVSQIMLIMHSGVKKYILKENFEDNEYHRMKLKRLYYLDRLLRGIFISALFITVYRLVHPAICSYNL